MADVFISYATGDRNFAEALANSLKGWGYTVWWDRNLPVGKPFDSTIAAELDACSCVVVLWSSRSVISNWVRDEAAEGIRRNILVPILIEEVVIPLGFRRIQAARLYDWNGSETHRDLIAVRDAVEVTTAIPPSSSSTQSSAAILNSGATAHPIVGFIAMLLVAAVVGMIVMTFIMDRLKHSTERAQLIALVSVGVGALILFFYIYIKWLRRRKLLLGLLPDDRSAIGQTRKDA